jgi:hypothetical protein
MLSGNSMLSGAVQPRERAGLLEHDADAVGIGRIDPAAAHRMVPTV